MNILWLFVAIFSADSAWTNNDDCFSMRPNNRSLVDSLNADPWNWVNIFPDLVIPCDSRLQSVTFHARRSGHVFISFWEETSRPTFKLLQKVSIDASIGRGVATIDLTEPVLLASGSILGIHYDVQDAYGVIDYERSDRPGLTPNVPLFDFYSSDIQDNGWMPGHALNLSKTAKEQKRNLALHLNLCPCSENTFGSECDLCSTTCLNEQCNSSTGRCELGCIDGYTGQFCETLCPDGMFGKNCENVCNGHCFNNEACDKISGFCKHGCASGFDFDASKNCNVSCSPQRFGLSCLHKCHCQDGDNCDHVTGHCPRACAEGYHGPSCSTPVSTSTNPDLIILAACIPSALILLCLLPIVIVSVKIWRRAQSIQKENGALSNDIKEPQAASLDEINVAPGYEALQATTTHSSQSGQINPNTDSSIYEEV